MVALLPSDTRTPQAGYAQLTVETVAGQSTVTSARSVSPMKLLVPRPRGVSAWAFTSSFGGGLVAGDRTELHLELGASARAFIGTQASTKIYRNPAQRPCSHRTEVSLGAGAVLVLAPDPVQAFAESMYVQRQVFRLAADAGLVLVDWFGAGRVARGERWGFTRLENRNEVFLGGQRVFLDSLLLDSGAGFAVSAHQVGRFNCFATCLLVGQPVASVAVAILAAVGGRPVERGASLITSASPVAGGVVVRIAGESTEPVGRELGRHLQGVVPLLGDDPWARKW